MKLLSLKPTINKVSTYIKNAKIEAKEKEIRRFVNLKEVTQPDAYQKLYDARECLANYAKANNVKLIFKTYARSTQKEPRMSVFAMNLNHLNFKNINSDTKATEVICREQNILLQNKDGLDYVHTGKSTQEDNFLRRVYRAVQTVTESINK